MRIDQLSITNGSPVVTEFYEKHGQIFNSPDVRMRVVVVVVSAIDTRVDMPHLNSYLRNLDRSL